MPSRRWMRRISPRICTRSLASRFESGSSNSSTLGLHDQGAGERDALLLTAGELVRVPGRHTVRGSCEVRAVSTSSRTRLAGSFFSFRP